MYPFSKSSNYSCTSAFGYNNWQCSGLSCTYCMIGRPLWKILNKIGYCCPSKASTCSTEGFLEDSVRCFPGKFWSSEAVSWWFVVCIIGNAWFLTRRAHWSMRLFLYAWATQILLMHLQLVLCPFELPWSLRTSSSCVKWSGTDHFNFRPQWSLALKL